MRRLLLTFVFSILAAPAGAATVAAALGDASITHDASAMTWSIAAAGTTLTLLLDPSRDFSVQRLATSNNKPWTVGRRWSRRVVACQARRHLQQRPCGADLPGRCRGARLGAHAAHLAHRLRSARLSEMGQQFLDQLRQVRSRPWRDRRQFRARQRAVLGDGGAADAVSEPADRERVGRRQSSRPWHGAV